MVAQQKDHAAVIKDTHISNSDCLCPAPHGGECCGLMHACLRAVSHYITPPSMESEPAGVSIATLS